MPTFNNQATLTYNGLSVLSNTVTGEYLNALSVTKAALVATYTPGTTVTYVVTLTNSGTTALTNLTVTDDLGAFTVSSGTVVPMSYTDGSVEYLINGTVQAAPATTAGPPLTVTGVNVPAGGNATLIYQALLNDYAPPTVGGTVTNTVTATGDGVAEPVTASATITATNDPTLTITKSLSPLTVSENQQITYTFVIENVGNSPADVNANIVVADTFDPVLTNLVATLNGTTLAPGTQYLYNSTTGVFTTTAGIVTVPAATYTQQTDGSWTIVPGTSTLTVIGTV